MDTKWRGQNRHKEIDHLTDQTGHKPVPKFCPKIVSQNWTSVATLVLQHPWGQRDSIMPRSKEDDAARKQEERAAQRGQRHSIMPRSKEDDAARKRECRSGYVE